MVRPVKEYEGFVLKKGLTIRATDGRFLMGGISPDIEISDIQAGEAARLGGVENKTDRSVFVRVRDCAGEVVLDNVRLASPGLFGNSGISISNCANLHGTDLYVQPGTDPWGYSSGRNFTISDSTAQLANVTGFGLSNGCDGCDGDGDGLPGWPGLVCERSTVILANPQIVGGAGSKSGDGCICSCPEGGAGGPGLDSSGSQVLLLGGSVKGGKGGDGFACYGGAAPNDGGKGGTGIKNRQDQAFPVKRSGVSVSGGKGGSGSGSYGCGGGGAATEGYVILIDPPYPTFAIQGELNPGEQFAASIDGKPAASVLLLLSSRRGWVNLPGGVVGSPLEALPGGRFVGLQGGLIPPSGRLQIPLSFANDPALRGFPLTAQAAVFGGSYAVATTNGATRVVGE